MDWTTIRNKKNLQPDEVDVVIYHDPCSDGFGSRVVAEMYLSTKFPQRQVTYIPMSHGAPFPPGLEGKNLLICDFSFRKNAILELLKKVNKLLIIDHHESAEKDLKDIDDKNKWFDMKYSGAMLTWFYFHPTTESPLLIKYIHDRDTWSKELPNTDAFAAWFHTLPFDIEEYKKYLDENLLLQMIERKGKMYKELNDYHINQALEHCVVKFCELKGKFYFIALVNFTICKSDIGNKVFDKSFCDKLHKT